MTNEAKLKQTFLKLLSEQPVNKITVKDLTNACHLNRNTFYYHFKNIPDLIESIVRDSVNEILAAHPPAFDSFEECLIASIEYAKANRQAITNIYNTATRSIFERHLWKLCEYTATSYLDSLPPAPRKLTITEKLLLTDFLKFLSFGFIMDWIGKGMPDNITAKIATFSKIVKQQIPNSVN